MKAEAHIILKGFFGLAIALFVGIFLTVLTSCIWPFTNSLIFGLTFFGLCWAFREDFVWTSEASWVVLLIAVLVCLLSVLGMTFPSYSFEVSEVVPDAIHRNAELGNRITVNIDAEVLTTTEGKIWILDDSNIDVRVEQGLNLYGGKTDLFSQEIVCRSTTNVVDISDN